MKKMLKNFLWKIYIYLYKFHLRYILKCQERHISAVFFKAYTQTFSLFPENKLKLNSDIAREVTNKLFDIKQSNLDEDIEKDDIQILYDLMESLEWTKEKLSNYFLLKAYYYSYGSMSDHFKETIDQAMDKAKYWLDKAKPISSKEISSIDKKLKLEIQDLKKEMRTLNAERIEKEKFKIIKPVTITSSHVIFISSIFSTLFILSGFIYNKFLFSNFGISVSDFFTISDYLASSVDVISATALSSALGLAFFFWGLSGALSEELHSEQFETEKKGSDYAIPVIIFTSSIALIVHWYRTGELLSIFLFPLIFFIALHTFFRFPIWKYIENRAAVGAVLLSIIIFSIHLGFSIKEKISDIRTDRYESPYLIQFTNKYQGNKNSKFISANSNYVFLWDGRKKKVFVIPKSEVVSYYAK